MVSPGLPPSASIPGAGSRSCPEEKGGEQSFGSPSITFNLLAHSVRTQQRFLPETKAGECLGPGWSVPSPLLSEKLLQDFRVLALKELGSPASGERPALSWARLRTCLVILAALPSAQKSLHACILRNHCTCVHMKSPQSCPTLCDPHGR